MPIHDQSGSATPYFFNLSSILMEELAGSRDCILLLGAGDYVPAWEELLRQCSLDSYLVISTRQQEDQVTETLFQAITGGAKTERTVLTGALTGWPCLSGADVVLILDRTCVALGTYVPDSRSQEESAHLLLTSLVGDEAVGITQFGSKFYPPGVRPTDSVSSGQSHASADCGLILNDSGKVLVGLEASLRDRQLLALLDYHVEMEGTQNRFRREKLYRLGPKVEELLELRSKAFGTGFSEQAHQEAKDAHERYTRFSETFKKASEQSSSPELSQDRLEELKQLYKKGSQLCHPDRVEEEFKSRATELFQQLSAAYRENNLDGVRDLVNLIRQEGFVKRAGDVPAGPDEAALALIRLREAVAAKVSDVKQLFSSDEWQKVEEYDDWESYFDKEVRRLDSEIAKIKGVGI